MMKYSVIIPVYNSEKTLARCLNSLVTQNRKDVQIIVVNDGSTDSSEAIIRAFADRYPQILYVPQPNGGVSTARNTGLDAAQGTYVTFVDSDDYVTSDYFEALDSAEDCDLLVFAHSVFGGAPLTEATLFADLQQLETTNARLALLLASRKIMSPCNKRFRLDIINRQMLRFVRDMHIGEDFNFCMAYAVGCQSIYAIPSQLLCVDISDQTSLSRKYRPRLDLQMLDTFTHITQTVRNSQLADDSKDQLLSIADYLFIKNVFTCISEEFKQKKLSFLKDRKRIREICCVFRQPLSDMRINLIHRVLRLLLGWRIYYPFYLVSYWVKGRKYLSMGCLREEK